MNINDMYNSFVEGDSVADYLFGKEEDKQPLYPEVKDRMDEIKTDLTNVGKSLLDTGKKISGSVFKNDPNEKSKPLSVSKTIVSTASKIPKVVSEGTLQLTDRINSAANYITNILDTMGLSKFAEAEKKSSTTQFINKDEHNTKRLDTLKWVHDQLQKTATEVDTTSWLGENGQEKILSDFSSNLMGSAPGVLSFMLDKYLAGVIGAAKSREQKLQETGALVELKNVGKIDLYEPDIQQEVMSGLRYQAERYVLGKAFHAISPLSKTGLKGQVLQGTLGGSIFAGQYALNQVIDSRTIDSDALLNAFATGIPLSVTSKEQGQRISEINEVKNLIKDTIKNNYNYKEINKNKVLDDILNTFKSERGSFSNKPLEEYYNDLFKLAENENNQDITDKKFENKMMESEKIPVTGKNINQLEAKPNGTWQIQINDSKPRTVDIIDSNDMYTVMNFDNEVSIVPNENISFIKQTGTHNRTKLNEEQFTNKTINENQDTLYILPDNETFDWSTARQPNIVKIPLLDKNNKPITDKLLPVNELNISRAIENVKRKVMGIGETEPEVFSFKDTRFSQINNEFKNNRSVTVYKKFGLDEGDIVDIKSFSGKTIQGIIEKADNNAYVFRNNKYEPIKYGYEDFFYKNKGENFHRKSSYKKYNEQIPEDAVTKYTIKKLDGGYKKKQYNNIFIPREIGNTDRVNLSKSAPKTYAYLIRSLYELRNFIDNYNNKKIPDTIIKKSEPEIEERPITSRSYGEERTINKTIRKEYPTNRIAKVESEYKVLSNGERLYKTDKGILDIHGNEYYGNNLEKQRKVVKIFAKTFQEGKRKLVIDQINSGKKNSILIPTNEINDVNIGDRIEFHGYGKIVDVIVKTIDKNIDTSFITGESFYKNVSTSKLSFEKVKENKPKLKDIEPLKEKLPEPILSKEDKRFEFFYNNLLDSIRSNDTDKAKKTIDFAINQGIIDQDQARKYVEEMIEKNNTDFEPYEKSFIDFALSNDISISMYSTMATYKPGLQETAAEGMGVLPGKPQKGSIGTLPKENTEYSLSEITYKSGKSKIPWEQFSIDKEKNISEIYEEYKDIIDTSTTYTRIYPATDSYFETILSGTNLSELRNIHKESVEKGFERWVSSDGRNGINPKTQIASIHFFEYPDLYDKYGNGSKIQDDVKEVIDNIVKKQSEKTNEYVEEQPYIKDTQDIHDSIDSGYSMLEGLSDLIKDETGSFKFLNDVCLSTAEKIKQLFDTKTKKAIDNGEQLPEDVKKFREEYSKKQFDYFEIIKDSRELGIPVKDYLVNYFAKKGFPTNETKTGKDIITAESAASFYMDMFFDKKTEEVARKAIEDELYVRSTERDYKNNFQNRIEQVKDRLVDSGKERKNKWINNTKNWINSLKFFNETPEEFKMDALGLYGKAKEFVSTEYPKIESSLFHGMLDKDRLMAVTLRNIKDDMHRSLQNTTRKYYEPEQRTKDTETIHEETGETFNKDTVRISQLSKKIPFNKQNTMEGTRSIGGKGRNYEVIQKEYNSYLKYIDNELKKTSKSNKEYNLRKNNIFQFDGKWNILRDTMFDALVKRDKLSNTDRWDDYIPYFTEDYINTYDFNRYAFMPQKLKEPEFKYTTTSYGTTRKRVHSPELLIKHILSMKFDLMLDDFVHEQANKYDKMSYLSNTDLQSLGLNENEFSLRPGTIIKNNGDFKELPDGIYKVWSPYGNKQILLTDENGKTYIEGYKKSYLLPVKIAETFDHMTEKYNPFTAFVNKVTSHFKRAAIMMVYPSFNFYNMLGDLTMLGTMHPERLRLAEEIAPATKFMRKYLKEIKGKEVEYNFHESKLREFIEKYSTVEAGQIAGEIKELTFENIAMAPFKLASKLSNNREMFLRLVNASYLTREIYEGREDQLGKKFSFIEKGDLTNVDFAGKVSRELLIDYLKQSSNYRKFITGFLFPFGQFYFQGSKVFNKWLWKGDTVLGKLGSFSSKSLGLMVVPMALNAWNNGLYHKYILNDEEGYKQMLEFEITQPEGVRNRLHFNMPKKNWTWQPQIVIDQLIGTKWYSVFSNKFFKLINGEISKEQAVKEFGSDVLELEAKGIAFLTNPLFRVATGFVMQKDPMDGSPIFPNYIESISKKDAAYYGFLYFNKVMNPFFGGYITNSRHGMSAQNAAYQVLDRFANWKSIIGVKERDEFWTPVVKKTTSGGLKEVTRPTFKSLKEKQKTETEYIEDIKKEFIENDSIKTSKDYFKSDHWKKQRNKFKELYNNTLTDEQKDSLVTRINNIFDNNNVLLTKINNMIETSDKMFMNDEEKKNLEYLKNIKKKILKRAREEKFKSFNKTIRGEARETINEELNK